MKITEIFYSLQGETSFTGLPTIFIRLTGCPLRCSYCDTAYAFTGGENKSVDDILQSIAQYRTKYVTVTGGEPLAQREECLALLQALCDRGYSVSLETSGALSLKDVDARVFKIMDIKTPSSLEASKNDFNNLQYLTMRDEIKFVIGDRADYEWSKKIITQFELDQKSQLLFSPNYLQMPYATLADWMLEDQLPVRFQVQLHKVVWGEIKGK
jgi:7-carboxy-7-deazaguanine synthase